MPARQSGVILPVLEEAQPVGTVGASTVLAEAGVND